MAGLMDFLRNYSDVTGDHALGQFIRSSPGYQQRNMQGPPDPSTPEGSMFKGAREMELFANQMRSLSNEQLLAQARDFGRLSFHNRGDVSHLAMPIRVINNELSRRGLISNAQPQE